MIKYNKKIIIITIAFILFRIKAMKKRKNERAWTTSIQVPLSDYTKFYKYFELDF